MDFNDYRLNVAVHALSKPDSGSDQFLERSPPSIGHLFITGTLIIAVGTRDEMMSLKFFIPIRCVGYIHPPSVTQFTLEEDEVMFVILHLHMIFGELLPIEPREVIRA